ncbi:MAG TPA: ATP-binding cassette domain-containing protein, partial [Acidimicrobiia bacterium]|nr:ATP-binding cassette domain-containing protein [Acidimicrobiia bacterium]
MSMLEISQLSKSFGGLRAINGLDLHVDEGEIVSVIGPNGAGKTTFFNLVTGMDTPDEGSIVFDGQDLGGLRPNQILGLGLARTFQNVRLFPAMTVLENVMVGQHARTRSGLLSAIFKTPRQRREEAEIEARAKDVLAFFGTRLVGYRFDQLSMVLSYANRRRLEIARAMASNPRLLL